MGREFAGQSQSEERRRLFTDLEGDRSTGMALEPVGHCIRIHAVAGISRLSRPRASRPDPEVVHDPRINATFPDASLEICSVTVPNTMPASSVCRESPMQTVS